MKSISRCILGIGEQEGEKLQKTCILSLPLLNLVSPVKVPNKKNICDGKTGGENQIQGCWAFRGWKLGMESRMKECLHSQRCRLLRLGTQEFGGSC